MLIENGTAVLVRDVILVWDNITKPDEKYNRYGGKFLIKKSDTASAEELTMLCRKVQQEQQVPLTLQFNANDPRHDGDCFYNGQGELVTQYDGCWVVNASSGLPVPVVDESGMPVDLNMQKPFYNGIGLNVIFNAYARKAEGNKGTSIGVVGVQIADRNKPKLFEGSGGAASHTQVAGMFGVTPAGGQPQQPAPAASSPAPAPAPAPAPSPAAPRMTPISAEAKANPDPNSPFWTTNGWTEDLLVQNGHFTRAM